MKGIIFAIERSKNRAKDILKTIERKSGTEINVEALAGSLGIDIQPADFNNNSIAGFLHASKTSKPVIFVNKSDHLERRRFTIAHEIGHFLLHKQESIHIDEKTTASPLLFRDAESSKATKIKEIEANQFAAELLMPTQEILVQAKKMLEKNDEIEDVIKKLAETYCVSSIAMSIKLNAGH